MSEIFLLLGAGVLFLFSLVLFRYAKNISAFVYNYNRELLGLEPVHRKVINRRDESNARDTGEESNYERFADWAAKGSSEASTLYLIAVASIIASVVMILMAFGVIEI